MNYKESHLPSLPNEFVEHHLASNTLFEVSQSFVHLLFFQTLLKNGVVVGFICFVLVACLVDSQRLNEFPVDLPVELVP